MDGRVKSNFWKCSVAVLLLIATLASPSQGEQITSTDGVGEAEAGKKALPAHSVASAPETHQDEIINHQGEKQAVETTSTGGTEEADAGQKATAPTVASAPDSQHQIIDHHGSEEKQQPKVQERLTEEREDAEHKAMMENVKDDTGHNGEQWEVSKKCLNCLCYFATDCDLKRECETPTNIKGLDRGMELGDCGPFHISMPFWADGNRVLMDTGDAAMVKKWKECSLDLTCATESIQKYFHKYHVDCNGDGKRDCIDYAAIHTLGPYGCMKPESLAYWNRERRKELVQCLLKQEEGAYTIAMRELQEKMKLQDIHGRKNEHQKEIKNSEPVGGETPKQEEEHKVHTEESAGKVEAKTNAGETTEHEHVQDQNEHEAYEHGGSHNTQGRVELQ